MKKIDCELCSLRSQTSVICNLAPESMVDFRVLSTPGLYKQKVGVALVEGAYPDRRIDLNDDVGDRTTAARISRHAFRTARSNPNC